MDERLKQEADAAERKRALEALRPRRPTEADLGEVMDVGAADEYVAATGEYPQSGDTFVAPDVVDDALVLEASLTDDPVGTVETREQRAERRRKAAVPRARRS